MAGIEHYENFPVASWLCPAPLRAPIQALYRFARCADDMADEGDAPAEHRLSELQAYRQALIHSHTAALSGAPLSDSHWPRVFGPLYAAIRAHRLPLPPLLDLLDAFETDVLHSRDGWLYSDEAALEAYCQRSAAPVGRLLLHLYGVNKPLSLQQSDDICTALQLINFWQDLSQDLARGRCYVPAQVLQKHGLSPDDLRSQTSPHPAASRMLAALCARARARMEAGAPLCLQLPGRIGWELRLVVQGGLRVLDRIAQTDHRCWVIRPRLGIRDTLPLFWAALTMPTHHPVHPTL